MNQKAALCHNQLCWPVNYNKRSFRVYVVEPFSYTPEEHVSVFNAAINTLLSPAVHEEVSGNDYNIPLELDPFDLVTFPEAFLTSEDLVKTLDVISHCGQCGCVHVGLRPTSGANHLFSFDEVNALVMQLRKVSGIVSDDLSNFCDWIGKQKRSGYFNLGCLFMLDANSKLRVCLHPKVIRSKFEIGMLHEKNMSEAAMLTLVSLIPQDKRFLSVTIQPLLCSDALNGETDRPGVRPIYAANGDHGDGSEGWVPDHIDVVSLATCTQQPEYGEPPETYSQWHPAFQDTFHRIANDDDLIKHHHAVVVLSNFRRLDDDKPGGLSGAFIPVPFPSAGKIPSYLTVSAWGQANNAKHPERWSNPGEQLDSNWHSRGYIASLRRSGGDVSARMIGFTVNKLLRQASRWRNHSGLTDFQLFVASINRGESKLTFKQQDSYEIR